MWVRNSFLTLRLLISPLGLRVFFLCFFSNYCLNRTSRDTFVNVTLVDTAKYWSILNNEPGVDLSIHTPGLYLTLMKGLILSVIDLSFLLVGQWSPSVQTTPTGIQTSNNSPLNY